MAKDKKCADIKDSEKRKKCEEKQVERKRRHKRRKRPPVGAE